MKMKFRKTPDAQRIDYHYESVTGERFHICAEECGTEVVDLLHSLDDREVRNNLKAGKPKTEEWQKESIRQWKEQHPGEELPKNWILSLDGSLNEGDNGDIESSHYAKEIAEKAAERESDPLKEFLRECVDEIDKDLQKLYRLYYVEEFTQTQIAELFGISQMAVSKRLKKLEAALKTACIKNLKNF